MLEQVCDYIHNYFIREERDGDYAISNGTISLSFLLDGQRFKIKGSALNDGVYTYHTDGAIKDDDDAEVVSLNSETFTGTIASMGIPKNLLAIVQDITAWQTKNQDVLDSPYTSESFGGYSYSKATGSGANSGGSLSWQDVFRSKLNAYRKIA